MLEPLTSVSQPHGLPRPVTGKAFTHFNSEDGSSMFGYVGIRPQDDMDVTARNTILVFQIFGWCI
jgi:hypothetical protein